MSDGSLPASTGPARYASTMCAVLFGLLLILILIGTAKLALHTAPAFDGAMNLQVASSIAHGEGYRRSYAEREPFPHEIQTGAPYILPAAAVFRLLGVSIPTAQWVNLAYFALLLLVSYQLVRQRGGPALARFAACTVALIPGMLQFGFRGYGEIPALALALAAVVMLHRHGKRPLVEATAAGVLIALAVITKTVMLIAAGAIGLGLLLELVASGSARRQQLQRMGGVGVGAAFTLASMEVWRAVALGGLGAWRQWWLVETSGILQQAGVHPGLADTTASLAAKLQLHLHLLSHDYRLAVWATALWLVLVCLATAAAFVQAFRRPGNWGTLIVLVTALVYMAWWLLITPTAKAWHRRIIDGMICADIGMVMFVAAWVAALAKRTRGKLVLVLVACVALGLPATWLFRGAFVLARVSATPRDNSALLHLVDQVRALPANAYVFGIGWYSAPVISLLADRPLLDFNDTPVSRMDPDRPVYFVQAPSDSSDYLEQVRSTYRLSPAPLHTFALLRAASLMPMPLAAGHAPVARHISAAENYPYLRGFDGPEGSNGRWLSADNRVLLTPEPGDHFELVAYAPSLDQYIYADAPTVLLSFDDCATLPQDLVPGQVATLVFPIPARCGIVPGRPVNVRIEVDNLLDVPRTSDPRPLGILAKEFGFVGPGH